MWASLLFLAFFTCPVNAEEIKDLPGLSFTPNFKHYSGYFQVSETHFLHYWFGLETEEGFRFVESQNVPTRDPLMFWFNGGPGCSSIEGLLEEMGPYVVNDDGATLRQNPNAWNRFANVLYLESPTGVGYSYSSDGSVTRFDEPTAAENYAAVKQFFTTFPQFRNHSTFIFGESYGGIFVPMLAALVLDGQKDFPINLQGVGIGNGLVNVALNFDSQIAFLHAHGFISEANWTQFEAECCSHCFDTCHPYQLADLCYLRAWILQTTLQRMRIVNPYDIYADCDTASIDGSRISSYGLGHNFVSFAEARKTQTSVLSSKKPTNGIACLNDTAFSMYMNRDDVRQALHIPKDVPAWSICSDLVRQNWTWAEDMSPEIHKLIDAKIPILLYYGDTDSVCNFLGAQEFCTSLGLTLLQDKRPWIVDGQVGGFSTVYEGLTFITVRGAGHMAPQWRAPQTAYAVQQFLLNQTI